MLEEITVIFCSPAVSEKVHETWAFSFCGSPARSQAPHTRRLVATMPSELTGSRTSPAI